MQWHQPGGGKDCSGAVAVAAAQPVNIVVVCPEMVLSPVTKYHRRQLLMGGGSDLPFCHVFTAKMVKRGLRVSREKGLATAKVLLFSKIT